ncbi:mCG145204, partial [Mus musculus]
IKNGKPNASNAFIPLCCRRLLFEWPSCGLCDLLKTQTCPTHSPNAQLTFPPPSQDWWHPTVCDDGHGEVFRSTLLMGAPVCLTDVCPLLHGALTDSVELVASPSLDGRTC